jgi:hypothetical protein
MHRQTSLSTKAAALARQIENKVAALDDQDLFSVLGLTRSCTLKQIFWAHEMLTRWFHPSRLARLGLAKLRPAARRILSQLDYARWILGDRTSRRAYEAQMDSDLGITIDIAA